MAVYISMGNVMVLGAYKNRAIMNSWVDMTNPRNTAEIIPDLTMGIVTLIKVWKTFAPRSAAAET